MTESEMSTDPELEEMLGTMEEETEDSTETPLEDSTETSEESSEEEVKEDGKKCCKGCKKYGGYTLEAIGFMVVLFLLEVFIVIFSLLYVSNGQNHYIQSIPVDSAAGHNDGAFAEYYHLYIEVAVMIFLGFGLLMSFLKFHGYFAMAISFLIACVTIQYAIVCVGVAENLTEFYLGEEFHIHVVLDLPMMIKSLFASGAVLISVGVLIGKVTPLQLLIMVLFEIPIYALNVAIVEGVLGTSDVGGSMLVHTFGAYFGIGCSWVASRNCEKSDEKNVANRVSDVLSMVGSITLWLLWPSFNGALGGDYRHRIAINTYFTLVACCITAFLLSRFLRTKFDMADLQNATLAGGVAIGSSADMEYPMAVPVLVGMAAAIISVVGYRHIQGLLEKVKLHDTCGVNNLHGMPGLLGGLVSVVVCFGAADSANQYLVQIGGLCVTFILSFIPGLVTGAIIRLLQPFYPGPPEYYYEDAAYFHVED